MIHNRTLNPILVCIIILLFGLGLALALPWMANSQSLAAQNEPNTPLLPSASTCYATPDNGTTVFSDTNAIPVQQAVDAVTPGGTVKVAGTCTGVQSRGGLTQTVYISKSFTLQGGYTQTNWLTAPDPEVYPTTLDAAGEGRVIVVTGTNNVTLDSFTITAGKVNSKSLEGCGGGIWTNSAFTLANSRIISNAGPSGGGMCIRNANPTIGNVNFSNNSAGENGGAVFNLGANGESNPSLTNVTFLGNTAVDHGGAMCNVGFEGESSPELTNVVFSGNTAGENGGGMYNTGSGITMSFHISIPSSNLIGYDQIITNNDLQSSTSSPKLTNVTFSGNFAGDYGGAMFNSGVGGFSLSHPELNNSILWSNKDSSGTGTISASIVLSGSSVSTFTHSLVEGAGESSINWIGGDYIDGGGNIDENPLFIEPISPSDAPTTTGNLRLQSNSPAIDAGNNDLVTVTYDLDNEPRKKDGDADDVATVDMGAYEAEGYYQLSVTRTGSGGGQVSSSPPGIDCGSACNHYFLEDTSVTLTASPEGNSTFTGWGGICSGTEPCALKMTSALSVTANFETNPQLSVYRSGSGDGTVTSAPKGINCGSDCSQVFTYGTSIVLSAKPDNYSLFKGWNGACFGGGECAVHMDAHKSVTAIFDKKPDLYTLYMPVSLGLEKSTSKTFTGRVTYQGHPVKVWVDLLKWNGIKWSIYDSIVSDINGRYEFKNVPALKGDQIYRVSFLNTYEYDGWLWFWDCWDVTAAATDPDIYRCSFDIENIVLYSPEPEAIVSVPQDFLWVPRVTTSDNYVLNIADMNDYDPWTWTDFLGYSYGVNILSLPVGFYPYTTYGWWVDVVSLDGWGSSYYYREVTFTNTSSPSPPDPGKLPAVSDLDWKNIQYRGMRSFHPRLKPDELQEQQSEK